MMIIMIMTIIHLTHACIIMRKSCYHCYQPPCLMVVHHVQTPCSNTMFKHHSSPGLMPEKTPKIHSAEMAMSPDHHFAHLHTLGSPYCG